MTAGRKRETLAQVRAERETARRWAVRLDGLAVRGEVLAAWYELRAERAEQDRDRALQRLSSCAAENGAYRAQRDEAVAALAELVAVVVCHGDDWRPQMKRQAAAIVERYRRGATAGPVDGSHDNHQRA
jgi:hypothetical protein